MLTQLQEQMSHQTPEYASAVKSLMRDARDGALSMLGQPVTEGSFLSMMERRKAVIDDVAEQVKTHGAKGGRKVACGDRCHYCCFQNVNITIAEAAFIVMTAGTDMHRIRTRLSEILPKVQNITAEQRYARSIPCPLLVVRSCGSYSTRPDVCRSYLSVSRTACQSDWASRKKDRPAHKGVPLVLESLQLAEAISAGAEIALIQVGLITGKYELTKAITVMARPGAIDVWLEGGDPFIGEEEEVNQFNGRPFCMMVRMMAEEMDKT